MLGGMWVMAWFGLRYPLKLLPLLMLDFVWKTIWVVDYGIPSGARGGSPPMGAPGCARPCWALS